MIYNVHNIEEQITVKESITPKCSDFKILTLFPDMWPGPLGYSLFGKGLKAGLWTYEVLNIRQFSTNIHQTVDSPPCGGGGGMILRPDVTSLAIDEVRKQKNDLLILCMSPRGIPLTQSLVLQLASQSSLGILCGRFEGVDQRVIDNRNIMEVSIGDFILSGGDIPAMALIEAILRVLPGIMGNPDCHNHDSFSNGLLEHHQYTKPNIWEGASVPKVLLSGNHTYISQYRLQESENITHKRRPDLWEKYCNNMK